MFENNDTLTERSLLAQNSLLRRRNRRKRLELKEKRAERNKILTRLGQAQLQWHQINAICRSLRQLVDSCRKNNTYGCRNSRCCDWRSLISQYNSIFIEEIPNADRRIVYLKNKYGELIYGVDLRDMRRGREINLIPVQLIPEADRERVRGQRFGHVSEYRHLSF